jgi:phage tail tape measure protein, lambda family
MAETSVGTAKLILTGDSTGLEVVIDRVKQKQQGLGDIAQQEAAKMTRAQRQVITTLDNQATKLNLTREQWLQYKVITQTTGDVQAALLAKIKANSAAIDQQGNVAEKTVNQLNKYGVTLKQQAAAMRGVPAQITDIFVSLQGGQNPLTVLLQQGGQLKDMFGGIVPAAHALGTSLLGLVNPATITAAAVAVVAAAYLSAENRSNAFNQALLLTGNTSRITADDLNDMAAQLDELSGVTSRQAASALTQVVANGKIAASQYQLVTEAAVLMEDAVGIAVEKTVEQYAELARDPVNAVLKLNETENFLTQSVYERIKALQDAGDIEGAAALATEARAESQIQRAHEVVESLGLVSGAWHDITNNTGEAWDAAVSYFIKLDRDAKDAAGTLGKLWDAMRSGPSMPWSMQNAMFGAPSTMAATTPQGSPDPKVNSAVQKQLDALLAGNRSREDRQKLEETQIVNLYKQLGIAKEDKRVQDALNESKKRYQESLPKGDNGSAARSLANAEASAGVQGIKDAEEKKRAEIINTGKVLQAQYAARNVTTSDYYAQQRELAQQDLAVQEDSLTKQIALLRSRDVSGKDSVNTLKQVGELEAKLAKVRADGATQLTILGIQEQDVADKRKRAVDAYREALMTANQAAKQTADAQLARIVLGQREAELQEKLAAVTADSAEKQRQLAREYAETNDYATYQEKLSALQQYTDEQVRIVRDGYDRMSAAQGDWVNGLKGGLAQWMEGAQNVADQTNAITKKGLDSLTEGFVNFATTGKSQWKSLLADIGTEIVKFMAKQAVLQFLQLFSSWWTGGSSTTSMGMTDFQGGVSPTMAADGGVFSGAAGLSAHSGTVVNKPTPFYFAKGAGVMGEAGWEGIFPLTRGSNGKLGVQAVGGGAGSGDVQVNVNVQVNSDGSTSTSTQTAGEQATMFKSFAERMGMIAQQEITKARMPGGQLWKAGVT